MQYRDVMGTIWARRYLLKASNAKLEVSTAAKARLAGACPLTALYCIRANICNHCSRSLRRHEVSGGVPPLQPPTASERIFSITVLPSILFGKISHPHAMLSQSFLQFFQIHLALFIIRNGEELMQSGLSQNLNSIISSSMRAMDRVHMDGTHLGKGNGPFSDTD